MNVESLTNFWPLIHSILQEFWAITEPHIEETAIQQNVPMELYYYSEFGLEIFSKQEFQKRDPYTNPEVFDRAFVTLHFKGWIELLPDEKYLVTEKAHEAARTLVQAGDLYLTPFESRTKLNLNRLAALLKQIVLASSVAPEPAEKWALLNRFRVADENSPWIVQIREDLMDLFAFRDDCHYAAAHPHFGRGGIIWITLGGLSKNDAVTAEELAESMPSRGYDAHQYDVALQAAVQLGWAQPANSPDRFSITQPGREIRERVRQRTDTSFFTPWSVLTKNEIYEFSNLLLKLKDQLNSFRKVK